MSNTSDIHGDTSTDHPQQIPDKDTWDTETSDYPLEVSVLDAPDFRSTTEASAKSAVNDIETSTSLEDRLEALSKLAGSTDALRQWGHLQVYKMLQIALTLILTYFGAGIREWSDAAKLRGIKLPNKEGNPFPALCKIIWGYWAPSLEGNGKRVWKENRSAEKYAYVMRYLHRKGIKVEEVVNYLSSFEHDNKRGISAVVQAERGSRATGNPSDTHPTNAAQTAIKMKEIINTKKLPGFVTVKRPDDIMDQPGGVAYFAVRIDGDELRLLGQVTINDALVVKDLKRIAGVES